MRLNTLLEVSVPETEYGYWIQDDGTIIPTTEMEHQRYAQQHFGPDASQHTALQAGWIRAIVGVYPHEELELRDLYHCYAEMVPTMVTQKALKSFKDIMRAAHKEANNIKRMLSINIELKIPVGPQSFGFGPNIDTSSVGEALRFLSLNVQPK